jgi:membrane-anchored glycerophosphoryl diester phosphodiesterase (GDPDase)
LSAVAGAYLITFLATFGVIAVGATLATLAFMMTSSNGRFVPGPGVFAWLLVFVATIAALLFVSVRWALTIPAIVVEGSGAMDALRRSWHLVSGSSWRVLGYVIAFSFVVGVIGALRTLPLVIFSIATSAQSGSFVPNPTVTLVIAFITTLVGTVLAPLVSIAMLLLYFDLRFRAGEQIPQPGRPSSATEMPPGPPTF